MASTRYDTNPTDASVVTFTPVLDTSAYTSGDVLFIPIEVSNVFTKFEGKAALHSVIISDGDDQACDIDLVFFNASASLGTINTAVSISDADAANIIGYVSLTNADNGHDLINSILYEKTAVGLIMQGSASSTSIWVGAVLRSGTPTFTASGMKIKLGFL